MPVLIETRSGNLGSGQGSWFGWRRNSPPLLLHLLALQPEHDPEQNQVEPAQVRSNQTPEIGRFEQAGVLPSHVHRYILGYQQDGKHQPGEDCPVPASRGLLLFKGMNIEVQQGRKSQENVIIAVVDNQYRQERNQGEVQQS
jgi:hypothetical protein